MQLITQKLISPAAFPNLSASRKDSHVYNLGASLCPSMDLVATYPLLSRAVTAADGARDDKSLDSEDEEAEQSGRTGNEEQGYIEDDGDDVTVDVWRFNGQRVFSVTISSDDSDNRVEIRSVEWRSDGQITAILSSDRVIRLVSSFSGKIVHRFSSLPTHTISASPRNTRSSDRGLHASARSNPKPRLLAFTTHFSSPQSTQRLLHTATAERSTTLDDLLSVNADIASLLKSPADLPRELANIDVESFLPRLSCLPPAGFGSEDVFSTRTSIDTIFHSSKKSVQSGIVDVLVAGHSDGMVGVRIFDSFEVGGIDLNSATVLRKGVRIDRVLKVASWPFSNHVYIVAQDSNKSNVHLVSMDLKFLTSASDSLPIVATKATQLHNLLRYLDQIQNQLVREVKTAFDLPTRYIRNLNEDLEKQDGLGSSFATAAYHAVVTGVVSGAFREWLNEQMGDRGVKRWEKSVGDCLELVRRLLSEAWCPAIERAGVVVSRLSGLAGWHTEDEGGGQSLGLDRKLVQGLQETIDVMAISGEECLKEVVKEISGFASFIKWLKWEVEASGLEETSERLNEMREASDHSDISKVLRYIDNGPQASIVRQFLTSTEPNKLIEIDSELGFYANFKEQRRRAGGQIVVTSDHLLARLRRQCDSLFERIAQSLRQGVMTTYMTNLCPEIDDSTFDVRIFPQDTSSVEPGQLDFHVLARRKDDKARIVLQTVNLNMTRDKRDTSKVQDLQPPETDEVLDIKFVDDQFFMVLVKRDQHMKIYNHRIGVDQHDTWELRHEFGEGIMEAGMTPGTLEINGRKKRRVVSVIDADKKGYAVYDLDSGDHVEGEGEEDETMTG